MKPRAPLEGVAAGIVLSLVAAPLLPIRIGPIEAHASLLAYAVLLATTAGLLNRGPGPPGAARVRLASAAAAVVLAELVALVLRAPEPPGWTGTILAGTAGAIGVYGFGAWAIARARSEWVHHAATRSHAAALMLAFPATFAAVRLAHAYYVGAGIANEDRSLLIGGHEIHHIVTGTVVLLAASLALAAPAIPASLWRAATLLLVIGQALVADQLVYYFLVEPTDEAYSGALSTLGGAVATAGTAAAAWAALRRRAGPV